MVIGLTGPTGCGKTTFSMCALKFGYKVIDCDELYHRSIVRGKYLYKEIVSAFGEEILDKEGSIDRSMLSKVVFSDKDQISKLNSITHPYLVKKIKEIITVEGGDFVIDAPLLIESGLDEICDLTVGVLSDYKLRMQRIIMRDKLSEERAKARINAGKPDDYYLSHCSEVLYNNSSEQEFMTLVKNFLMQIKEI